MATLSKAKVALYAALDKRKVQRMWLLSKRRFPRSEVLLRWKFRSLFTELTMFNSLEQKLQSFGNCPENHDSLGVLEVLAAVFMALSLVSPEFSQPPG